MSDPGDVRHLNEYPVSAGIDAKKDRTVLDARKVFVRLDGQEISLEDVLRKLKPARLPKPIPPAPPRSKG